MTIEELRIGNTIGVTHYEYGDMPSVITSINDCGDLCLNCLGELNTNEEYECTLNEVYPIPITEEMLVKNGFELIKKSAIKDMKLPMKIIDRLVYIRKVDDMNIELDGSRLFINNGLFTKSLLFNDVKYIHEIQNAYQLFANKELKIEL